tara:strand:+ start:74 stop:850 length:777 start_codon:yes stop_codon:yes gene_type:complete
MKKAIKLIGILYFGIFSLSLNIGCGSTKLSNVEINHPVMKMSKNERLKDSKGKKIGVLHSDSSQYDLAKEWSPKTSNTIFEAKQNRSGNNHFKDTIVDGRKVTVIDGQVVKKPTKNCRAFVTGRLVSDHFEIGLSSKVYKVDDCSEYVGEGKYMKNEHAFPKAVACTFDGIAIAKGTRVVIYSEENLQGDILLDQSGPALINNIKFKGRVFSNNVTDSIMTKKFKGKWNQLFPPSCRKYSSSNMHNWVYGSLEVICED